MLPSAEVLWKIAEAFALRSIWFGIEKPRGCRSYTHRRLRAAGSLLAVACSCFGQPAVQAQPTFSASTLPNGTIGEYYSQNVSIVGDRKSTRLNSSHLG